MAVKKANKGDSYVCEVCGLAVTVDKACGCTDECNIMCCGKPMTVKQAKTNIKKK
jgi:hypothetical protein